MAVACLKKRTNKLQKPAFIKTTEIQQKKLKITQEEGLHVYPVTEGQSKSLVYPMRVFSLLVT